MVIQIDQLLWETLVEQYEDAGLSTEQARQKAHEELRRISKIAQV